ncbi:MAG: DUF4912 domain-containing protein [Acidobacteria bacterium]|nr:DUF4912 domain-containing protein [Acidobacteriota bacterium]
MSENDKNDELPETAGTENEEISETFELSPISSAEMIKADADEENGETIAEPRAPQFLIAEPPIEIDETEEVDPIFAELAAPKLPELQKENRARLQMQSPTRLYFYWSVKNNPFRTLQKVFSGNTGSYRLVARFVNLKTGREEMYPVEAEGNFWLRAEPDAVYRAEIGFYAPNRPYIRVIHSNTIETPRRAPSRRAATDADWAVNSRTFAQVLDNSGFRQDAFEVALAGDDRVTAEQATQSALDTLISRPLDFSEVDADEVRFALLALASGVALETLRGRISEALFIVLEEHTAQLSAENAFAALKDNFEIFDEEIFEEEETGPAVFGASLINFPKTLRKRTVKRAGEPKEQSPDGPQFLPKLAPLSSFSLRN